MKIILFMISTCLVITRLQAIRFPNVLQALHDDNKLEEDFIPYLSKHKPNEFAGSSTLFQLKPDTSLNTIQRQPESYPEKITQGNKTAYRGISLDDNNPLFAAKTLLTAKKNIQNWLGDNGMSEAYGNKMKKVEPSIQTRNNLYPEIGQNSSLKNIQNWSNDKDLSEAYRNKMKKVEPSVQTRNNLYSKFGQNSNSENTYPINYENKIEGTWNNDLNWDINVQAGKDGVKRSDILKVLKKSMTALNGAIDKEFEKDILLTSRVRNPETNPDSNNTQYDYASYDHAKPAPRNLPSKTFSDHIFTDRAARTFPINSTRFTANPDFNLTNYDYSNYGLANNTYDYAAIEASYDDRSKSTIGFSGNVTEAASNSTGY